MKKIILLMMGIFLISLVSAAYYVTDPNNCPTSYQAQTCSGTDVVCGYSGGITYCYDPASISPPSSAGTTSTTNYACSDTTCNGGFVIDCYYYDGSAPHCDNGNTGFCDRNSTCYDVGRITQCTANVFIQSTCTTCISGYTYCDGSYTDVDGCEVHYGYTNCASGAHNNINASCNCVCDTNYCDCDGSGAGAGNGCENQTGADCTIGGAPGSWSCTTCTCVPGKSYYETGTFTQYLVDIADGAMLWFQNLGTGDLINATNVNDESFRVDAGTNIIMPGNITLGDKILFRLGEIIHNLIDGLITIEANLNVTGTGEFENITLRDNYICNETACFTLQDLNETGGGIDTWALNYTFYYNKSELDNNFSLYYTKTEVDNNFSLYLLLTDQRYNETTWILSQNYITTETDPAWTSNYSLGYYLNHTSITFNLWNDTWDESGWVTANFLQNIVEDTTPQLGGNLDGQTYNFTTTGLIGIGTTSFDSRTSGLQVKPSARGKFGFLLTDIDDSEAAGLYVDLGGDGGLYLYDEFGGLKTYLTSDGDSYMKGGNFGLETVSPTHTLNVVGDANITGDLIVGNVGGDLNISGIIFLPDGSASAPALSFISHSDQGWDTGIFMTQDGGGHPEFNFGIEGVSEARITQTGFDIKDSLSTNFLKIVPSGTAITGARSLTIDINDVSRTIDLTGNPTLADWFDQSVKQASSPTFKNPIVSGNLSVAKNIGINTATFSSFIDGGFEVTPNARSKFGLLLNDYDGSRAVGFYIDGQGDGIFYIYNNAQSLKVLIRGDTADSYFNSGQVGFFDTTPSETIDAVGNIRADDFIEYSKFYVGDALLYIDKITAIQGTKIGNWAEVNHSSLPEGVLHITNETWFRNETGESETIPTYEDGTEIDPEDYDKYHIEEFIKPVEGRSLTGQSQFNLRAIQQLKQENEDMKKELCILGSEKYKGYC